MQTDIFEKIRRSTGGPIGQYRDKADGYFAFPKLECASPGRKSCAGA